MTGAGNPDFPFTSSLSWKGDCDHATGIGGRLVVKVVVTFTGIVISINFHICVSCRLSILEDGIYIDVYPLSNVHLMTAGHASAQDGHDDQ